MPSRAPLIPAPYRLTISRRALLAVACAIGAAAGAPALAGCSRQTEPEIYSSSTFAFDTYCTFTVYGDASAPAALARACADYDALFDLYNSQSDIARVNAARGTATEVDPATAEIVKCGLEYSERFDGLFDITIGAVSTLWNFEEGTRPADADIQSALAHVGWRGVKVDETDPDHPAIQLADPDAKLDLGAIAKGFIADKLVELLQQRTSATAAAISLGGNVAYFGEKPDGSTWDTGIRDPNDPGGSTVVGTAHTQGGSLVTSGLYERTFEVDGVTYWHILDPATGMPVKTDTVSVTVACPVSTRADALSTTLFVAGSSRGKQLVDAYEDTAAYFMLDSGATTQSSRWQELTQFESGD